MVLLCAQRASPSPSGAPDVIDIGSRLQLFLDTRLVDRLDTATLRLHRPERREVVFRFDAPWEGGESGYVTVLRDGDQVRLYYRGGGETTQEVTCVAFSDDAVHFTRPKLGLFEYNGSKDNNIIWKGREKAYWESHNFTPFLDINPAAAAAGRYKAVALGRYPDDKGERRKMLVAFVSPDGIHWRRLQEDPIIREGAFDSQNLAFWDAVRREYVCYSRIGVHGVRSVQRNVSPDFVHWSAGEPLDFGPGPLEQFYTNAIQPYPRNPALFVGFPMRFVPERKTIGANHRPVDGLSDAVVVSSHDGLHFDRTFREAFIRPGLDPANWGHAHGNNTPAWGLLRTGDAEMSVYWTEHYGGDTPVGYANVPQLRRGALRTDGFASLHAPWGGGEVVTRPIRFEGRRLVINTATSAVGSVRIELQDEVGRPLPGFTLDDCEPIYGDEIARTVAWAGGRGEKRVEGGNGLTRDVSAFANRPIRLRIRLRDADLYSLAFGL